MELTLKLLVTSCFIVAVSALIATLLAVLRMLIQALRRNN